MSDGIREFPQEPSSVATDEVEALLMAYDEETEAVPLGHENVSLGASTYGWRKRVVKQLREMHGKRKAGRASQ